MKNNPDPRFSKAREYAFLLLKFRQRSEREICERLKRKKFEEPVIKETIRWLKEKKFIGDALFARAWIDSRLSKPYGPRRLILELRKKGVASDIIKAELENALTGYCEEEVVRDLASQRYGRLKGVEPYKAKSRVQAYLLRRGFSPDVIIEVVNQL